MKLFVDDVRPAPKGWYLAKTVTQAIYLLDSYSWDTVSLDHDIFMPCLVGEETITKMTDMEPFNAHRSAEDFTAVARFIVAKYRPPPCGDAFQSPDVALGRILIHTANPEGAKRLMAILEMGGFCPERDTTYGKEWENR